MDDHRLLGISHLLTGFDSFIEPSSDGERWPSRGVVTVRLIEAILEQAKKFRLVPQRRSYRLPHVLVSKGRGEACFGQQIILT